MIFPLCVNVNAVLNFVKAIRRMTSSIWENSVLSVRKNFRRAGVLKKRLATSTVVPTGCDAGLIVVSISRPCA